MNRIVVGLRRCRLVLSKVLPLGLLLFFVCTMASASVVSWFPFGPDGGDARAFAADPKDHNHLYLGTAIGWIYESHDGGHSWRRLARVGHRDDLVLDNIVVDPADSNHLIVGAWILGQTDGGLYVSHDAGVTWISNPAMKGQSIRALAVAPSNAKIMVAGTLAGIFRSTDSGEHWEQISPVGSTELHEVESIAIDPNNAGTIYAGTWHLPWKTSDGGAHWSNIKQGIIDDSDVFSIIIDPKQPKVVYASACSGIYKSENGGEEFKKIEGIPSTARRTRVLMQDPEHLETVFAGTTEGLFRTDDAGAYWTRITSEDVIVNDVYVDPTNSKHVLMAIDRGGVLASDDGGTSFIPSNTGFSARQITALTGDYRHPSDLYLGVVNDKQWGGAFVSHDGGLRWQQIEQGLDGRNVFSLAQAQDGTIVAGTEHGLFVYDPVALLWQRVGEVSASQTSTTRSSRTQRGAARPVARSAASSRASSAHGVIEGSVLALAPVGGRLFAVTSEGVFASESPAALWTRVPGLSGEPWQFVSSGHGTTVVASLRSISISADEGRTWRLTGLPAGLSQIGAIAVDGSGTLWLGGREGIFASSDQGMSWTTLKDLYVTNIDSLFYDVRQDRLLVTSGTSTMAFSIHLPERSIHYWTTGWNMRFLRPVGDYLVGATMFDGIVVQPRMVQSEQARAH